MNCSIKELRQKTREILELVEQGEEVIITFRGVPKARVLPIVEIEKKKKKHKHGFGMWKNRDDMQESKAYVRNLRKGRYDDR